MAEDEKPVKSLSSSSSAEHSSPIDADEVAAWFCGKAGPGDCVPSLDTFAVLAALWEQERTAGLPPAQAAPPDGKPEPASAELPPSPPQKTPVLDALKMLQTRIPEALAAERRRQVEGVDLIVSDNFLENWLMECDRLLSSAPVEYFATAGFGEEVEAFKRRLPWHYLAVNIAQRAAEAWKGAGMGKLGHSTDARFAQMVFAIILRVNRNRPTVRITRRQPEREITLGSVAKVLGEYRGVWNAGDNSPFKPAISLAALVARAAGTIESHQQLIAGNAEWAVLSITPP